MALVIPWLLVREYQQHRNALADQLSRVTGWRVVKVVIHPGELEEWARRQERSERSGALTVEWRFRRSCRLCLGAPLLDLLGTQAWRSPCRCSPTPLGTSSSGFLEGLFAAAWFILDAGISQDWQECSHSSRNDLHDHYTVAPSDVPSCPSTAFRKLVFRTSHEVPADPGCGGPRSHDPKRTDYVRTERTAHLDLIEMRYGGKTRPRTSPERIRTGLP